MCNNVIRYNINVLCLVKQTTLLNKRSGNKQLNRIKQSNIPLKFTH